jgi:hypothetical protein
MKTLASVNDVLAEFKRQRKEIKRRLLGCYNKPGETIVLKKELPVHNGETCHHRFSFNYPGNRCGMCNSLLFLGKTGELKDDITIDVGECKGESVVVVETKPLSVEYEVVNVDPEFLNKFCPGSFVRRDTFKTAVYYRSKTFSYAVLSSLMQDFEIQNSFIGEYTCNSTKTIKFKPEHVGTFKELKLSTDFTRDVLLSLKTTCEAGLIVHGRNSMEYLSFGVRASRLIVHVDPCECTSFSSVDYHERTRVVLSPHADPNKIHEYVPGRVVFTNQPEYTCFLPDWVPVSPVISGDFVYTETVPMTNAVLEFNELSGVAVFTPLEFYLWLIVLLCEEPFYENTDEGLLSVLFFEADRDRVLSAVKERHGQPTTYKDVRELCVRTGFRMRIDALVVVHEFFNSTAE